MHAQPPNASVAEDRKKRRTTVLELHLSGLSYRKIAQALNIAIGTVSTDLKEALEEEAEARKANAGRYREIELHRLEKATLQLQNIIDALGSPPVDEHGHPVRGWKPPTDQASVVVAATRAQAALSERRSKLQGLDAPQRHIIEQHEEQLRRKYEQMAEDMALGFMRYLAPEHRAAFSRYVLGLMSEVRDHVSEPSVKALPEVAKTGLLPPSAFPAAPQDADDGNRAGCPHVN